MQVAQESGPICVENTVVVAADTLYWYSPCSTLIVRTPRQAVRISSTVAFLNLPLLIDLAVCLW